MRKTALSLIVLAFVASLGVALTACGDDSGPEDLYFKKDLSVAPPITHDMAAVTDAESTD
jgi:predicted small lipoprotein YifL